MVKDKSITLTRKEVMEWLAEGVRDFKDTDIRKANLENPPSHRLEGSRESQIGPLPPLFFPSLKHMQGLGIRRGKPDASLRAKNLDKPRVRLPRGKAFHLQPHGYIRPAHANPRVQ